MIKIKNAFLIAIVAIIITGCVQNPLNSNNANSLHKRLVVKSIEFKIETSDEDDLEIFTDGIIPWVSLDKPEDEVENLIGKDDIVLQCDSAIVLIDYPLTNAVGVVIKPKSSKGFTKSDLVLAISAEYKRIYKEEEESATVKTLPMEERGGIINRNQTNGEYGIWGHDLADLDLSSIIVSKNRNGLFILELDVYS